MTEIKKIFEELLRLMNIGEFSVEINEEGRRLSLFLSEDPLIKKNIPGIIENFNLLGQLVSRRLNSPAFTVDVNNYRLEREKIIAELAKAAARKALMTKDIIALPIMNSYERRLIHMELAMRPDIKTESEGEGKMRHVVIKPILE